MVSPFNIWFARGWASCFLYIWGFWSNNPGHGFEKLTQVDIFFGLFSFSILSFKTNCFFLNIIFMVSSIYFILDYLNFMTWPTSYAGWLAAYYLDYMSITLSRVYLFCICFYPISCFEGGFFSKLSWWLFSIYIHK